MAEKNKWVIVKRIHVGLDNHGCVAKMEEYKYERNLREFELLKRGTHAEIIATDLTEFTNKDLTAEDVEKIQENTKVVESEAALLEELDTDLIVLKADTKEKSPETKVKPKTKGK